MSPDTSRWAWDKQVQIALAMTGRERAMLGIDQTAAVRKIVEASILAMQPNLKPGELACAVFERYYGHEYTPEKKSLIKASILAWYEARS